MKKLALLLGVSNAALALVFNVVFLFRRKLLPGPDEAMAWGLDYLYIGAPLFVIGLVVAIVAGRPRALSLLLNASFICGVGGIVFSSYWLSPPSRTVIFDSKTGTIVTNYSKP